MRRRSNARVQGVAIGLALGLVGAVVASSRAELGEEPLRSFAAGDAIVADEVNQNFTRLRDAVREIEARLQTTDDAVSHLSTVVAPGTIAPFAGAEPPEGWLLCDGSTLHRSEYPDLLEAIGETWGDGGDIDPDTFQLPDLRGLFLRGADPDRPAAESPDADAPRAVGSFQDHAIQSHGHTVVDPGHTHSINDPGHTHEVERSNAAAGGSPLALFAASEETLTNLDTFSSRTGITVLSRNTGVTIGNTGGNETRPQNRAVTYMIRASW